MGMNLLARFRNTSIQTRLTSLLMLVSTFSVVLAAGMLSVLGYYNMYEKMHHELANTAQLVGERNVAYISFNDIEGATRNLQVLSLNPSVRKACLYDRAGNVFAFYNADGAKENICPKKLPADDELIGRAEKQIFVFRTIAKQPGSKDGVVYLESDFRPLETYARKQIFTLIGVLFTVLIIALALALLLQRSISAPLLQLAQVARAVAHRKDYSLRANIPEVEGLSRNEIGSLVAVFNTMLAEISEREKHMIQKAEELQHAKDAAEAASRAKSHFLANIGHELRTPLNAIIGFSSILVNQLFGPLGNAKYVEYARDINESGVRLLDIINDILDLSKAEAGKLSLAFEEVNVSKAISKCVNLMAERAAEGGVTVETQIPKSLPYLLADRLRFIQIILNLLSNAVKFTEPGGKVTISVEMERDEATQEARSFYITIADTGIGMAVTDLNKAYQSFGQIDSDLNRKYEGSGLGLPLTKKLLDLHHGEIHVESTLGVGTTVRLRFYARPPLTGGNAYHVA
jgi:signal transduction histidine kinase